MYSCSSAPLSRAPHSMAKYLAATGSPLPLTSCRLTRQVNHGVSIHWIYSQGHLLHCLSHCGVAYTQNASGGEGTPFSKVPRDSQVQRNVLIHWLPREWASTHHSKCTCSISTAKKAHKFHFHTPPIPATHMFCGSQPDDSVLKRSWGCHDLSHEHIHFQINGERNKG